MATSGRYLEKRMGAMGNFFHCVEFRIKCTIPPKKYLRNKTRRAMVRTLPGHYGEDKIVDVEQFQDMDCVIERVRAQRFRI